MYCIILYYTSYNRCMAWMHTGAREMLAHRKWRFYLPFKAFLKYRWDGTAQWFLATGERWPTIIGWSSGDTVHRWIIQRKENHGLNAKRITIKERKKKTNAPLDSCCFSLLETGAAWKQTRTFAGRPRNFICTQCCIFAWIHVTITNRRINRDRGQH